MNSLTSFYSGFVIFTFLGYMAVGMKKDIENVASEGYGLVFQVYPEAISTLPFAQLWCLLFFFMLVTLGLDSAVSSSSSHHHPSSLNLPSLPSLLTCISLSDGWTGSSHHWPHGRVQFQEYKARVFHCHRHCNIISRFTDKLYSRRWLCNVLVRQLFSWDISPLLCFVRSDCTSNLRSGQIRQ